MKVRLPSAARLQKLGFALGRRWLTIYRPDPDDARLLVVYEVRIRLGHRKVRQVRVRATGRYYLNAAELAKRLGWAEMLYGSVALAFSHTVRGRDCALRELARLEAEAKPHLTTYGGQPIEAWPWNGDEHGCNP